MSPGLNEPNAASLAVEALLARLAEDQREGNLPVPELPAVALRVRRAVEDPALGIADVARLVELDPVLTARVMQSANSARFGGLPPVGSCQAAVSRLGLASVRDLVVALSVRASFQPHSKLLAGRMKALWQHSVRVAAISHVLATVGPDLDPERALLAGLVHDVGELPLLSYAEQYPELIADEVVLDRILTRLRGRVGALVLKNWGFEEDLVRAALEAELWTRDPAAMPDYADVVLLANIFSGFGGRNAPPPLPTLPVFNKFPLGALGPEGGVELLEEAQEHMRAVMQLLE